MILFDSDFGKSEELERWSVVIVRALSALWWKQKQESVVFFIADSITD